MANDSRQGLGGADWAGARGERWRGQVRELEAMLVPVNDPLFDALALDGATRVADVGCGGGATTIEIARRALRGAVVEGFDIAPPLVALAQERARAAGVDVAFHLADVSTTAPPAPPFDRLVSRFGIMFFAAAGEAFANLHRWLAPGGRFAFAAWGPLADNPWMSSARAAVAEVVELPKPEPDAPGPFRYGDVATFLALLGAAGFSSVEAREWRGALPVGGGLGPADAAAFSVGKGSTFAEALAPASDADRARALASLTSEFARHVQGGVVMMDARVHVVTGAA
jgi:SAM-dependent methyltransferase